MEWYVLCEEIQKRINKNTNTSARAAITHNIGDAGELLDHR